MLGKGYVEANFVRRMNERENKDECLAKEWLVRQGHTVRRLCDDPPDYEVDGQYAVEVRRLNQRIEGDGQFKGEEQSRIPLRETIENVLKDFGPPIEGQGWIVDCEYDFSKPLPEKRITKKEIREALQTFTRLCGDDIIEQYLSEYLDCDKHADELEYLKYPHLCLPCGICLELAAINVPGSTESKFLLQNVSDGEGIGIADELIKNLQLWIKEKSRKVRQKTRLNDYQEWWLILVDHICVVPISILGDQELQALRESIQDRDFWSRIIIISSKNINGSYTN